MPVIINDFEVVMEPQGGQNRSTSGEGQPAESGGGGMSGLRPEDIEKIMRHYFERYARVLAD